MSISVMEYSRIERSASALTGRDVVQETAISPETGELLTLESQGLLSANSSEQNAFHNLSSSMAERQLF